MLIRAFNLENIKKYEIENNVSLIDILNTLTIDNLAILISIGNNMCSEEQAYEIIDKALDEGKGIVDIHNEIRDSLFGRALEEDESGIDITKCKTLTDVFMNISMNLMSVGVSYSEFWSMNTSEMHIVFNNLIHKIKAETDRRMAEYHGLAGMIGAAAWGKLPKEPPKMEITERINGLDDDEDSDTINNFSNLTKIASRYGGGYNGE